jgi:hypothetical protein
MALFEEALAALRAGKAVSLAGRADYYHFNALGDLVVSVPLGAAEIGKPLRGDYACSGFAAWQVLSDEWLIHDRLPFLERRGKAE